MIRLFKKKVKSFTDITEADCNWLEFYRVFDQTTHNSNLERGAIKALCSGLDFEVYRDGQVCVKRSLSGFLKSHKEALIYEKVLTKLRDSKLTHITPFEFELRNRVPNSLGGRKFEVILYMPWLEVIDQDKVFESRHARAEVANEVRAGLKSVGLELNDTLQFGNGPSGPLLFDLSSITFCHR
jgi:hypothetical protein